jgi:hypothetical protein
MSQQDLHPILSLPASCFLLHHPLQSGICLLPSWEGRHNFVIPMRPAAVSAAPSTSILQLDPELPLIEGTEDAHKQSKDLLLTLLLKAYSMLPIFVTAMPTKLNLRI